MQNGKNILKCRDIVFAAIIKKVLCLQKRIIQKTNPEDFRINREDFLLVPVTDF